MNRHGINRSMHIARTAFSGRTDLSTIQRAAMRELLREYLADQMTREEYLEAIAAVRAYGAAQTSLDDF